MQIGIRLTGDAEKLMERRARKINESTAHIKELKPVTSGEIAKSIVIDYLYSLTEDDLADEVDE